jgi:hypothetical protein
MVAGADGVARCWETTRTGAATTRSGAVLKPATSREFRRRSWSFVGPTTLSAMESLGMVNDHLEGCLVRPIVEAERDSFQAALAMSDQANACGRHRGRGWPPSAQFPSAAQLVCANRRQVRTSRQLHNWSALTRKVLPSAMPDNAPKARSTLSRGLPSRTCGRASLTSPS